MSARGRPLRFLAVVSTGWVSARVVMLWPEAKSLPEVFEAMAPVPEPSQADRLATPVQSIAVAGPIVPATHVIVPFAVPVSVLRLTPPLEMKASIPSLSQLTVPVPVIPAVAILPDRLAPIPDRWSVSGWLVARPGGTLSNAPGGQLGGSQAGIRIAYRLSPRTRLAAFARLTAPLSSKGREAALGIEWQPSAASVRLIAEQRFGLDGTPGGTGLGLVAGTDNTIRRLRLETYGQAGAISRRQIEPYADGAARLTKPLGKLSFGASLWGAAQRDAQRLDLGPTASLTLHPIRISLDWRQRVAGRARPGSGPALAIGGDF